mmetsp:Transcript_13640/g.22761  ORF Transcript_13640/g.22761 Transcript_13640/m.22761 type:complete len:218 (-) Transcript_13640:198-851(-)
MHLLADTSSAAQLLKCAGPMLFMGLQTSSIKTAFNIHGDKSVGDLSPFPFLSLFTNSLVWTMYGLLRRDPSIIIPNFTGVLAGAGCTVTYSIFARESLVSSYIGPFLIILASVVIALKGMANVIASIGCILAVIVMSSPLATINTVIRNKNTDALPFWTSLTACLNGLAWGLYGLLVINDPAVIACNFMGFFFGCIQMLLFGLYGLPARMKYPEKIF